MSCGPTDADHVPMNRYMLYHRHAVADCAAAFAAWNGVPGALRGTTASSTCPFGGHEIWWFVHAERDTAALALLPAYVATRTVAIRVADVELP